MARNTFYAVLLLRLGPVCGLSAVETINDALKESHQVQSESATVARSIPDWRLQQVLNSSFGPDTAVGVGPEEQIPNLSGQPFGTTRGQDGGRCPVVTLPGQLTLRPTSGSWRGLSGSWTTSLGGIGLASFGQNFFSQDWDTVDLRNFDQRLAVKAVVRSVQQLEQLYGWKAEAAPSDFPIIQDLERTWASARATVQLVNGLPSNTEDLVDSSRPPAMFSLTDCEGHLMFVVSLSWPFNAMEYPGGIDIYDRQGNLLTHAMVDPNIAKFQFVDSRGYLLAVAESPGINQNVSMRDMPRDRSKGNVLPFELQFDGGGYANTTRLLDADWRWALAAAVQLRAIQTAHSNWTPPLPVLMVALFWVCAALGICAIICTCGAIFRLLYPYGAAAEPLSAKAATSPYYYATAAKNV